MINENQMWAVWRESVSGAWTVDPVRVSEREVLQDYVKVVPLSGGDAYLVLEDDLFCDLRDAERRAAFCALGRSQLTV